MSTDQGRFVPVNTSVLLQTLVEAVHEKILERLEAGAVQSLPAVLTTPDLSFAGADEAELDQDLRVAGYLARSVEVELFEPARRGCDRLTEMIEERRVDGADHDTALTALCAELAHAEPVNKPSPDDPAAMSWQVPGPGGHVRHYVARRSIEELLQDREDPVDGDPADLKRAWMYGFFVAACEEIPAPDDAVASS